MASLFNIDNTIGAAFIGWGVSSLIFGILCIQVYTYYQRYPNDSTAYKLLVAGLWILEAVHQAFVGHCVYFYDVSHYGDVLVFLEKPAWTLSVQVILGALAGAIVKGCFGLRVWKFSKHNYFITATIMLMALGQLAFAFVFTIKSFHLRLSQASDLKGIATSSLALGTATDILTAGSLSYFLHKMRTGYAQSDSLINRLILYSVNNGFITSACSITVLILYNLMPNNFIFMGFYFVLSKLYANSCLATLNTRRFVRGKGTDREETNTGPTFLMVGSPFSRSQNRNNEDFQRKSKNTDQGQLEVGVHHEVSITSDPVPQYASAW